MAGQIFLSYRRDDSAGDTRSLFNCLERHFSSDQLVMDVDTIPLAEDYEQFLSEAVGKCDALIAVIGTDWLSAKNEQGQRRLDEPDDLVRIEIAAALARGIQVFPVMVQGAPILKIDELPEDLKPLAKRQAAVLTHARFNSDAEPLILALDKTLKQSAAVRSVVDRSKLGLKISVIIGVATILLSSLLFISPMPQDPQYHLLADQRSIFGISNFWNLASNIPFLVIGFLGMKVALSDNLSGGLPELRIVYAIYFVGTTLICLGSIFYHTFPSSETMLLDRWVRVFASMAFFCIVLGEYLAPIIGIRLLLPTIVLGLVTVIYWAITEALGVGDLRPYAINAYLYAIIIPLIVLMFRSRFLSDWYIWPIVASGFIASVLESQDSSIFASLNWISGHSLSHMVASAGSLFFLFALLKRVPVEVKGN